MSVTFETFQPDIEVDPELLKDEFDANMEFMFVAADVFQLPIFWLNPEHESMDEKLVTLEVFQLPIG